MSAAIVASGLHVDYGPVRAVDDVSFEIPAGASAAVIGPNGSGKSTVLKVIAGVIDATAGTYDTAGERPAIVLQSTDVDPSVPLTVRDVVSIARFSRLGLLRRPSAADRDAVQQALVRLELDDLAGRQIHQLSGGQRQRALVAQGLAQQSKTLLLDEPFVGLDVRSRAIIDTVLADELAAGRTVVTTTHDFDDASKADLVILLASSVIAFGPPAEVFTEEHLRAAFGGRFVRVGGSLVLDDPHHDDPSPR